jgi:hypothetical protein
MLSLLTLDAADFFYSFKLLVLRSLMFQLASKFVACNMFCYATVFVIDPLMLDALFCCHHLAFRSFSTFPATTSSTHSESRESNESSSSIYLTSREAHQSQHDLVRHY